MKKDLSEKCDHAIKIIHTHSESDFYFDKNNSHNNFGFKLDGKEDLTYIHANKSLRGI